MASLLKRDLIRLLAAERRPIVIKIEPSGLLSIREAAHRKWYTINLHTLYLELVKRELT